MQIPCRFSPLTKTTVSAARVCADQELSVARKYASDKVAALGMTKTVIFAARGRELPSDQVDFQFMKPRKGFTHASREMWDAWISSTADSEPEQVYRSALGVFTASMVLVVHEKARCRVLKSYDILDGQALLADEIARELITVRHRIVQRQARPVAFKEMVEKEGKFAAFEALLLPQKGGSWCVALVDVQLLLPIPRIKAEIDDVDRAILRLLFQGSSGKEIGIALGLSHRTIEHRTEKLKQTFGARTIAQLVTLSIAIGLAGKVGN